MKDLRGGEPEVYQGDPGVFMLGSWTVYPNANELRDESDTPVRLETKVMDVLRFLVETPGTVRSKESIIEAVWPDVHVSEDALFRCIRELRRALGDSPRSPKYIETIPKKGYRLIAEVKTPQEPNPVASRDVDMGRRRGPWRVRLGVSGLLLLFLILTFWLVLSEPVESEGARVDSLAVLPFVSLEAPDKAPDLDLEYLSVGLSDGVAYSLSRIDGLRVVSNVSSLHYRGGEIVNPRAVARELGVETLLFGRLIRSENSSLLVSVELVDGRNNELIWGHTITGSIGELMDLQETIVEQIAERLSLQLSLALSELPSDL